MKTFSQLREDIANNVGSGNIAGTTGDPPMIRRKQFGGHEVFEVDSHTFHRCRLGKLRYHRYSRYVGEDQVGQEIRAYGRQNPRSPIVLQDVRTGAMIYLRYHRRFF
jgi:hypothetical protein